MRFLIETLDEFRYVIFDCCRFRREIDGVFRDAAIETAGCRSCLTTDQMDAVLLADDR